MDKKKVLKTFNAMNKGTLMETLNIEYTAVGEDFLVARMPVNKKVYQPLGILHGGATAALAETVGSAASMYFVDREKYITKGLELSINHVKSVQSGYIYATAKFLHKGTSTHLWEIKVVDDNDNLISFAKLTNVVLEKR